MEVSLEVVEDQARCSCSELEERSKKAEARCEALELQLLNTINKYEHLEAKILTLEAEKVHLEVELKKKNGPKAVDLTLEVEDDFDRVTELMIENSVLGCEKKKAESEVVMWKQKFRELELRILHSEGLSQAIKSTIVGRSLTDSLNGNIDNHISAADKTYIDCQKTQNTTASVIKGDDKPDFEVYRPRRVRRHLEYEEETIPTEKVASPTLGGNRPACLGVIDISDSDSEVDVTIHMEPPTSRVKKQRDLDNILKMSVPVQSLEDDIDICNNKTPSILTPKRKRANKIVSSDSESDDDNVPICKLKKMHIEKQAKQKTSLPRSCSISPNPSGNTGFQTPSRKRLLTLRQCEGISRSQRKDSNNVEDDDESEEFESNSASDSMEDFIVESSSDCNDGSIESHKEVDEEMGFEEIISKLQRNKDRKLKWEFEADMLADFGKDPELCMTAVCALYRQQTEDEKCSKEALIYNGRGFSKFDALRGSIVAEFLTDGDPMGDLKKSKEELHEHDPNAVELCQKWAARYSKQLFEIYQNKEDPLFLPS